MDATAAGTLLSALAAAAMAALAWLKTRKSKPQLAEQQVNYMARINDRMNAELSRRDKAIADLENDLRVERSRVADLQAEVTRLRQRITVLEAG